MCGPQLVSQSLPTSTFILSLFHLVFWFLLDSYIIVMQILLRWSSVPLCAQLFFNWLVPGFYLASITNCSALSPLVIYDSPPIIPKAVSTALDCTMSIAFPVAGLSVCSARLPCICWSSLFGCCTCLISMHVQHMPWSLLHSTCISIVLHRSRSPPVL